MLNALGGVFCLSKAKRGARRLQATRNLHGTAGTSRAHSQNAQAYSTAFTAAFCSVGNVSNRKAVCLGYPHGKEHAVLFGGAAAACLQTLGFSAQQREIRLRLKATRSDSIGWAWSAFW